MSSGGIDLSRNPCPDRILEDVGFGFGMGLLGGSAYHFAKGLYNSPRGHRLAGGATAARMKAPRHGGAFAVWGGLFSTFDCALVHARNKEDPWNAIAAGGFTEGLLALRRGLWASAAHAATGAAFLALIEGAGIMLNRFLALQPPLQQQPNEYPPQLEAPADGLPAPIAAQEIPGSIGLFGGLFGRKQHDHKVAVKSELLELDLPSTVVPSFD
ncbi:unnamed protein product [Urochloa decumbens]|uniref:Uncharacterized protein n=1 Tax=Urochloa decumbens TaxID=240449 RepID=A0ABC8XE46_9POAL